MRIVIRLCSFSCLRSNCVRRSGSLRSASCACSASSSFSRRRTSTSYFLGNLLLRGASRLALCIRAPGLRRASGQADGARARAQAQSAAHPCMTRQRCGGRAAPHRTRFCRSAQARRGNCGPSVFGCVLRTLRHRPESAPEPQFVDGAIVRVLRSISHDARRDSQYEKCIARGTARVPKRHARPDGGRGRVGGRREPSVAGAASAGRVSLGEGVRGLGLPSDGAAEGVGM